jgi:hypothetical protein
MFPFTKKENSANAKYPATAAIFLISRPRSTRLAEKVMKAAKRCSEGKGIFSTRKSRDRFLEKAIKGLDEALVTEPNLLPISISTANFSGRTLASLSRYNAACHEQASENLSKFIPAKFGSAKY